MPTKNISSKKLYFFKFSYVATQPADWSDTSCSIISICCMSRAGWMQPRNLITSCYLLISNTPSFKSLNRSCLFLSLKLQKGLHCLSYHRHVWYNHCCPWQRNRNSSYDCTTTYSNSFNLVAYYTAIWLWVCMWYDSLNGRLWVGRSRFKSLPRH